uniref:GNAT family N-acetyltransferase n=1 Tax=Halomonas sp. TaxID=1486246 RepID=UPI0026218AA6|nr:GNAT family N-acetyltransferase [Halomonas sp.]
MNLVARYFRDIDLNDAFFDSLKGDYSEFSLWFDKKARAGDSAYVFYNDSGGIDGFLYLKIEDEGLDDVTPPLPSARRLKIGTLKINPHGTRLGERFVKKAFDHAIENELTEIYVTVFSKHSALVSLFQRYGFVVAGEKSTHNGIELVLLKKISAEYSDPLMNYPLVDVRPNRNFLLSLYPKWHTRLLPDSILNNEHASIVQDVSHTNSIHKVYLTKMRGTECLRRGDTLLIYRTSDNAGPARYRSVVTSVCMVEEVRSIREFSEFDEFYRYCEPYSVFSSEELRGFYARKNYPVIIRFSYNLALKRRITRGELIDQFGLNEHEYWGFMRLHSETMKRICIEGGINESLIVD